METIGKVIGGTVGGKVHIRLKSDAKVHVGDLVTCSDVTNEVYFMKITNVMISSLIGPQFIEDMAGQKLEYDVDYELFDQKDRFYRIAEAKLLKIRSGSSFLQPRAIPNFFSDVSPIDSANFSFVNVKGEIPIGSLRLGTESISGVKISLPAESLISHHMLVVAATGKGKSNFAKVFLRGILNLEKYSAVIFDPHNEYFGGRGAKGLRDHPLRKKIVYFSPRYQEVPTAEQLKVYTEDLEPDDFFGIINLSDTQQEAMDLFRRVYGKPWIRELLNKPTESIFEEFGQRIHKATIATLKRKMYHALELEGSKGLVFDTASKSEASIYDKVKKSVSERKLIIVDTSMVGEETEKIISASLLNRIFTNYREAKQRDPQEFNNYPEVLVLFEEAPRVLGSEVLAEGTNIFERIAREGRKFKVGLCAITQMPSLLPREILSQMNTKVILGLPAPMDRDAVVNSASQNIADESAEIQMLDKGEAIITSPFIDFPLPVKIFHFDKVLEEDNKNKQITLTPVIGIG
ncbi:MAG: ATP-binding protein [Candidatus Nanoarchaeia archaeon]|nr:ATP-binding protein [Candidatus Nanoarchaeia archaeon]MDD5239386.1 ATP-binding protein [Candidatus Nanoarchaeia archaeon]